MIKSGKFRALIGFLNFPMKVHITYGDQVLRINASDLPGLRAVVKKAIKKAEQLGPTDEDKQTGNIIS